MKLSTRTQYGLRALVYLAKKDKKICSLKEMSNKEGIPFDYLEKIISRLIKSGFIESKKGVSGGYLLKKRPKQIKIGDVINILEGNLSLVSCMRGRDKKICPREKQCLTKGLWQKIQDAITNTLKKITLADLLK